MKKSKKPKSSQSLVEDLNADEHVNTKCLNDAHDEHTVVSSKDSDTCSTSKKPSKRKKEKYHTLDDAKQEHDTSNKKRKNSQSGTSKRETKTIGTVQNPDSEMLSEQSKPEKALTPAEKAAKKEKREKMRKKKDAKKLRRVEQKQQIEASLTPGNVGTAEKEALDYIQQWQLDPKQWKFNKVRQVWLLQHMYDMNRVSDDDFALILKYLEGLQGKAREVTKEKAERVITELDQFVSCNEQEMAEADTKLDRARQIIQML